jgi:hypothetical protein
LVAAIFIRQHGMCATRTLAGRAPDLAAAAAALRLRPTPASNLDLNHEPINSSSSKD